MGGQGTGGAGEGGCERVCVSTRHQRRLLYIPQSFGGSEAARGPHLIISNGIDRTDDVL